MRLAKYIAHAGVASRRHAEELIAAGGVTVNGTVVASVAMNVDDESDTVAINGRTVAPQKNVYYLVYKPKDYISAARGRRGEKLVTDLVPKTPRVYPVGRLDKDTEGLLILTNDGALAYQYMHPKHNIPKTYEVVLDRSAAPQLIACLRGGVRLTEGMAAADEVSKISSKNIRITIHQGWNRQVRRMVGSCGWGVVSLVRVAEGALRLGTLQPGEHRKLSRAQFSL